MAKVRRGSGRYDSSTPRGVEVDLVPRLYPTTLRYVTERAALGELTGRTPRTHRYVLKDFAEHVGTQMGVTRLGRRHVTEWLLQLEARGICPNTRYSRLMVVRAFCKWCALEGLLRHDPTLGVKGPRRQRPQPRALTRDEIARLLDTAPDLRAAVCVLLGCQEGLRRAEILHLTVSDFDFTTRVLRVFGKGQKERYVDLSDETAETVDAYLAEYPAGPSTPLVRSYQNGGKAIHPDHLTRLMQKLMTDAKVKRRPLDGKSAHALRHSCAEHMIDLGAEIRDVQEKLGHAHASTTWDVYGNRKASLDRLKRIPARTYRA